MRKWVVLVIHKFYMDVQISKIYLIHVYYIIISLKNTLSITSNVMLDTKIYTQINLQKHIFITKNIFHKIILSNTFHVLNYPHIPIPSSHLELEHENHKRNLIYLATRNKYGYKEEVIIYE